MTIRLSNVSTHVSTLKYNKKKLSINNLKMDIECSIRHLVPNHVLVNIEINFLSSLIQCHWLARHLLPKPVHDIELIEINSLTHF